MRGGLDARARQIHEPEFCRGKDAEKVGAAFWRDVDVARAGQGRRTYPEYFLGLDPWNEGGGDFFVIDAHCGWIWRLDKRSREKSIGR